MKKSLLYKALNIALSKLPQHPEYDYFPHYSFVVQNNKILDYGTNNKKVPPYHHGFHKRINNYVIGPKTHSEINAYRKAKGLLIKNRDFEMINIRLNKKGQLRISKPCCCCYEILSELGCSKFFYSSDFGFLSLIVI